MSARLQHQVGDFIGPGQQQYQVLEKLVSGGMGTVYRVENKLTGNIYAVKECDVLDDPAGRELSRRQALQVFLSEGREVERLQHPNIPRGFLLAHEDLDFKICGQCGVTLLAEAAACPQRPLDNRVPHPLQSIHRRLYLFMDYIDGVDAVTAASHMPKPLTASNLETLQTWLSQAAAALGFLHERGLIHRDVKPENIIITPERAYLLDFGLVAEAPESAKTRRLHMPTAFHGTKGYAAPEQIYGHPRRTSDSYALAMTFLSLATGEDPSRDEVQTRFAETHPQALIPGISRSLAECIEKARDQRPENRPTMAAWIEALSQSETAQAAALKPTQTRRLRPGGQAPKSKHEGNLLRPGQEGAGKQRQRLQKLRPGKSKSGASASKGERRFALPRLAIPHLGKGLALACVFVLAVILWPSQDPLSFEAEALPGATIYQNTEDLRQGRILDGGEILRVKHAKDGHRGNWLVVQAVNGKRTNGFLLRSKVFRGRS